MGLQIQLFGGFSVWRDGTLIDEWGSEQTKTLLKIFLTEPGHPFLHDQLLEYLWPDTDLKKALSFLRARIHSLRQSLEPDVNSAYQYVQTCPGGYRFNKESDCVIDVQEFRKYFKEAQAFREEQKLTEAIRSYESALELYVGEYLPEDRYEDWAIEEREKWKRLYVSALMDLADCYARVGRYRRAIDLCLDAITEERYREDIYRQAMLYSHLMGNSNEANRIFQRCARTISEGLGVEPDIKTLNLASQIAEGHVPDLDPDYKPPVLIRHPIHHSLGRLPFVGRETELSKLLDRLEQAKGSKGGIVLIGGEVGIGKSRLAQEIVQIAQRQHGYSILKGRSSELGNLTAYQVFIAALRFHLSVLERAEFAELPKFSLAVLQHWFSGLEFPLELPESPPRLSPEEERLRLFEAVTQLCIALSSTTGPILMWLDDLQWADPSSIDLLDYMLPRLEEHSCLILGTYRTEEVGTEHHLRAFIRDLDRNSADADRIVFELERLGANQVQEILHECDSEIADRGMLGKYLHDETDGNPLFLVALMQSLFEEEIISVSDSGEWVLDIGEIRRGAKRDLPRELQEVIHARIERLEGAERVLVECLSIIGNVSQRNVLKGLWEEHERDSTDFEFLQLMEALERLHVIYTDHEGYHFAHDKIREVVYGSIHPERRTVLHGTLVHVLEGHHDESDRPHELFAYHYTNAGMPSEALRDLVPALKQAVSGYRNSEALELSNEALILLQDLNGKTVDGDSTDALEFEILAERSKVFHMLGDSENQSADLNRIEQLAQKMGDQERIAEAILMRSSLLIDTGEYAKAQAESYKALAIANELENHDIESRSLHNIGLVLWNTGDNQAAKEYFEKEYALLDSQNNDRQKAETLHYLSGISWRSGDYKSWEKQVAESLALRDQSDDLPGKVTTLNATGVVYWSRGNYLEALQTFEEVRQLAQEIGDRRGEARALGNMGMVSRYLGKYEEAITHISEGAAIHTEIGDKRAYATDLNNLGMVNLSLGVLKTAQEQFKNLQSLAEELGLEQSKAFALNNLATVLWCQSEFQEAIKLSSEALTIQKEIGDQRNIGFVHRTLGGIYLDSSDPKKALDHFNEALVISKALNSTSEQLILSADLSCVHLALGDIDKANQCAEESLILLKESENLQHFPRVKYCQYQVLQAAGRVEEAQLALTEAYESLQEQAAGIKDEELRRSFLRNVPLHQKILDAKSCSVELHELPEDDCYELLRTTRWPDGIICTACESSQIREHGKVSNSHEKRYLCTDCKKTFGDRTGTMFANSNLPLPKLFQAVLLAADLAEPESAKKAMKEQLEIHARTANNLYKKTTDALQNDATIQQLAELLKSKNC